MLGLREWASRGATVLALLGAVALLAVLATPLAGLAVDEPEAEATTSLAVEADPDGAEAAVRELPLLPLGTVSRADLADPAAVEAGVRVLAGTLGLGGWIDELLSTYDYAGSTYPYVYPVSDSIVAGNLDPGVVLANRDAVVELAGLLAVLGAGRTEDFTEGPAAAATAYSLLSAAREVHETCDLALTVVYLVSLGDRPHSDAIDEETRRATEACGPDDATPALVRAHWLSRHASVVEKLAAPRVEPSRIRREARDAWLELQQRFPASPWGFAGLADLEARWADQAAGVGASPFQVLAWRREALASYAAASSLVDDPLLESRAAEVLVQVGEKAAGSARARAAADELAEDVIARMALSDVLAAAGDHEAAAESVEVELGLAEPWWLGFGATTSSDLYRDYAQRVVPAVWLVDASVGAYGGGFVSDLGFLPQSRAQFASPECRRDVRVRELMRAGRLAEAAAALDAPPPASAGITRLCLGGSLDYFRGALEPALGVLAGASTESASYELAQDFLRDAGDLGGAEEVAHAWVEAHPEDGLALQRLAEIHLLAGHPGRARPELETALPLLRPAAAAYDVANATFEPNPVKDLAVAELQLGLALERLGEEGQALAHYASAVTALAPLQEAATGLPPGSGAYPGDLEAYAHSQAGAVLAGRDQSERAIEEYRLAIAAGTPFEPFQLWTPDDEEFLSEALPGGVLSGAQTNNLSLLLSLDGQDDEAIEMAEAALFEDPASSVFTDTLAFAYQRAGEDEKAVAAYRRVVRADPSAYVSANNLGVLLAESGEPQEAEVWFRRAVATEQGYAQAWHHLGSVLRESWAPAAYVASQAAFAEAVRLDSSFRDVEPGYEMDAQIRDLDLDVSRSLDPDWQFATSVEDRGPSFTAILLLLVLLRVAWSLGLDTIVGRGAEGVLARGGRLSFLATTLPAWGAGALCVALLTGTVLAKGLDWAAVLVTLCAVGLVTVPLVLRGAARHRSWVPAMAVGVALAPLGSPFVPYPNLVASRQRPTRWRVHLPALVVSAALVAFAVESALAGTPVAHRMTALCAVVLASVLVPVPPLDGSRLTNRSAGLAAAVLLGGLTVALSVGWV
ncbi:tetratricopeptide repeat protein [Nocardioides dilutus]